MPRLVPLTREETGRRAEQLVVQRSCSAAIRSSESSERARSRAAAPIRCATGGSAASCADRGRVAARRPRAETTSTPVSGVTSSGSRAGRARRPAWPSPSPRRPRTARPRTRWSAAAASQAAYQGAMSMRSPCKSTCASEARRRRPASANRRLQLTVAQHVDAERESPRSRSRAATSTISSGSFCAVRRVGKQDVQARSASSPAIGCTRLGRELALGVDPGPDHAGAWPGERRRPRARRSAPGSRPRRRRRGSRTGW